MRAVRVGRVEGRLTVDFGELSPSVLESGSIRVFGVGEVYSPRAGSAAEIIAGLYRSGDLSAVDGAFMAVIHDTERDTVTVVTDPVGARKAYLGERAGEVWVANRLPDLPTDRFALDPAGVGCYLSSDGTHGGLTPFDGIVSLPAATKTVITNEQVDSLPYWVHAPTPEGEMEWEDAVRLLQDEVGEAVERRLSLLGPDDNVYLSLSGGHDSKGLLGFLGENLPTQRIKTFSYRHRGGERWDDATAAETAADIIGSDHRLIPGYRGDFFSTLRYNARHGHGLAHFCDDADVWAFLETDPFGEAPRYVFVGDRRNHWYSSVMGPGLVPDDLLGFVNVEPVTAIESFLNSLSADAANAIRKGWGSAYADMAQRLGESPDWRTSALSASLEERVGYTLTLWRERFTGRVAPASLPYLDRSLLDAMAQIPAQFFDADRRSIHREAIERAFPRLFEESTATFGGWNIPGWGDEMARSAGPIRRWLTSEASRLDELIPPEAIVALLDHVERRGSETGRKTTGLTWQARLIARRSRRLRKAHQRLTRHRRIRDRGEVERSHLLRRLLNLRMALDSADT